MNKNLSYRQTLDVTREPKIGEVIEILAGVNWLRLPVPFPPGHINVWLLDDGDGWTLVDCGMDSERVASFWNDIAGQYFNGKPLIRIIVTHHHADHLGMAAALSQTHGAEILMTSGEFDSAQRLRSQTEALARIQNQQFWQRHGVLNQRGNDFASTTPVISGVRNIPANVRNISDGEIIRTGAHRWRAIVVGGHTAAHLCLYSEEFNLLIAGDQILPGDVSHIGVWPDAPDTDPIGDYLESLNRLGSLPKNTTVMPSHGALFSELGNRLAQLKKYYYNRLRQVFQLCEEPRSAAELIPFLCAKNLSDTQYQFALAEMVGCLNNLQRAAWIDRKVSAVDYVQYVQRSNQSLSC